MDEQFIGKGIVKSIMIFWPRPTRQVKMTVLSQRRGLQVHYLEKQHHNRQHDDETPAVVIIRLT